MAKKKSQETVAYSGEATEVLRQALQDNLSPEAVVGIAESIVDRDSIKSADVRREVEWFRDFLVEMVGCEYDYILKEIGL